MQEGCVSSLVKEYFITHCVVMATVAPSSRTVEGMLITSMTAVRVGGGIAGAIGVYIADRVGCNCWYRLDHQMSALGANRQQLEAAIRRRTGRARCPPGRG